VHAVPEGEGDAWMHLVNLQELLADGSLSPALKGQYKLQERNFEAQLGQRTGQMLRVEDYAPLITQIISFPGLRKDFKSGTFESFVLGRNIEV
jgi:hypothetical protein